MNAVIYAVLILAGICAVALWIYSLVDLSRAPTFSAGSKIAWRIVILLVPVGGPIAYFSAKKYIERFSLPEAGRVGRLTAKERR